MITCHVTSSQWAQECESLYIYQSLYIPELLLFESVASNSPLVGSMRFAEQHLRFNSRPPSFDSSRLARIKTPQTDLLSRVLNCESTLRLGIAYIIEKASDVVAKGTFTSFR